MPWLRSPWLLGCLLALAVFAVYANSLRGEWIYDDYTDILGNQSVQRLWPLKEHFLQTTKGLTGLHPRPLVSLSFTLNFLLGQNDPFLFHLTNVAIHALASLCLFGVLRRTLAEPIGARWALHPPTGLAFTIALLWGLHPLQTEAVAYVTQRYESLMGLFVFLALLCVIRSTQSRHPIGWSAAAVLSCLLALASKEVAISLPILVLLYDRTFLAGSFRGAWRARRPLYLAFVATWILFAWNQLHVAGRQFAGFELPWTWWQYAMNQPAVILHYLRLTVWPQPLVLDYLWQPATTLAPLVPGWVVVGGLLAATLLAVVRNSWTGFLGAFFFLILAPTSSVLPILDLAVEHRMYLPLAPVLVFLVLGAHGLSQWLIARHPRWASSLHALTLASGASALALLGSLTYLRSDDYRDSLSLWRDTVIKMPDNPRARTNYAHALERAGKLDEAIAQLRFALSISPGNVTMRGNLGALLEEKGDHPQAIQELQKATQIDPTDARPWINLGLIHGRMKNLPQAEEALQRALTLDPRSAPAHLEMGNLASLKGDAQAAMRQYQEAMRLQPGFSLAHWGAGEMLLKTGHLKEALEEYALYISLESQPTKAANAAAHSLLKHGHPSEAMAILRRALQGEPSSISTLLLMSWTLATHPQADSRNGAEALALAEQALRVKGDRAPATLEVLATAYAELGRFPEACAVTEEALARLKTNPAIELSKIEARLALFRKGEPYREDPAKYVQ